MTYCTPYLLALGLSKSTISLVWIAGPLSGLLVQPLVGVLADQSTSPFGRRRPFMFLGTVITVMALLVLGWTKEVVAAVWPSAGKQAPVVVAVGAIYVVDFAINAVMAASRSLLVDTLPLSKQQSGSAWASRMAAVGHLISYAAGAADLERIFGNSIGDSQFKRLTVVAAFALATCVCVTCIGVEERVLISRNEQEKAKAVGVVAIVSKFANTVQTLPTRIAAICWVTFWCWIGWFPFLFYSTTWIGEVYIRYEVPTMQEHHLKDVDTVSQVGRVGSAALVTFSIVTVIGSIVLPWCISSPDEAADEFTPRPPQQVAGALLVLRKYRPTLLTAWVYSIIIFSACMICTPFVTSLRAATMIVAVCGIPWAIQCWAPFTFLGIEVNRLATPGASSPSSKTRTSLDLPNLRPSNSDLEKSSPSSPSSNPSSSELSGAYLGILNLYTTMPQFIGSFVSCAVFTILDPGRESETGHGQPRSKPSTGPNAIAVCLFIGGLAAIMATRQARRLDL
jgi:solute carrier family 45 protein 1/2/4